MAEGMVYTPQQIIDAMAANIALRPDVWVTRMASKNFGLIITGNQGGDWLINCSDTPGITPGNAETADCYVTVSQELFDKMFRLRVNPQVVFQQGKAVVKGKLQVGWNFTRLLLSTSQRINELLGV